MNIARHIGNALRSLGPAFGELVESLTLVAGGAAVAYGAWEIYRPAGPIAAGVLLITGTLLRARGT